MTRHGVGGGILDWGLCAPSASVSAARPIAVEITISDRHVANMVSATAMGVVSLAEIATADFLSVKLVYVAWAEIQFDAMTVTKFDSDTSVSVGRSFRSSSGDSGGGKNKGKQSFHGVEGVWCWWEIFCYLSIGNFFSLHMKFGEIDAPPNDSIQMDPTIFNPSPSLNSF